jgi:hypothetical protein
MGIDLGHLQELSLHAIMDGKNSSFADNDDAGNYGPSLF